MNLILDPIQIIKLNNNGTFDNRLTAGLLKQWLKRYANAKKKK